MYRPLPLAALLLLLLSIAPTGAEVVKSMADCEEFFLQQTPPDIPGILEGGKILNQNRYKLICQTFSNRRSFVTLYDTKNKIPVFSAYKYRETNSTRPKKPTWKVEPQLEDIREKNMQKSFKRSYNHQAANADYTNNSQGCDRGHLFPSSYASSTADKESTFTLTNAVPQEGTFNKGSWKRMEECTKYVLDKYCVNSNGVIEAFLVTGAQPGTQTIGNKVNVPSMLWSAFCCYSHSEGKWLASAHWGKNVKDSSDDLRLQTKTLEELSKELSTPNSKFEPFPGTQCPPDTAVTQLYPELQEACESLPTTTSATSKAISNPLISTSTNPATNPTTTKTKTTTTTTTTTTSTTAKEKDEDEKENKLENDGNPEGGDPVPNPGSVGLLGVLGMLLIGIFSALATCWWLQTPKRPLRYTTKQCPIG